MKLYSSNSKPQQKCLMAMVSLNQLKREFQDFQVAIFDSINLAAKQSMEGVVSFWKYVSHQNRRRTVSKEKENSVTTREREKPNEDLKVAFDMLNQKQNLLEQIQNKLIEAEESKEELLSILQRQTQLCTQLRNQQQTNVIKFNDKVNSLQRAVEDKDSLIIDLMGESTVLKRLLKQEYQSRQNPLSNLQITKDYCTNTRLSETQPFTRSKKILRNRNSDLNNAAQCIRKLEGPRSTKTRQASTSSSKFLRCVGQNDCSSSVKSQIQRIIQKAVKQNYQKQRHP